jgi:DNA invertase Pin-like site-specific DNA recombinase
VEEILRVALYVRVSTAEENSELQLRELREYTERQGLQIVGIYQDVTSGAKSNRPELNRLMLDTAARKFDCLLVWKLDRFGRSLVDCLNNIHDLERNGIRFIAVTQGLDTDQKNPASRFLLHVLGAAAEFERSLIRERTQAGQARYRQDFESGKVGKTVAGACQKFVVANWNTAPHVGFGGAEDAGLRPLVRATRQTGSPDPGAFRNTYPFIGVQVSVNERVALKSSIQNRTYDLMDRMHTMPDAQRLHHSLGIE